METVKHAQFKYQTNTLLSIHAYFSRRKIKENKNIHLLSSISMKFGPLKEKYSENDQMLTDSLHLKSRRHS